MITPTSLALIAFIVALLVGTKRLRHIGEDLGEAVKNFRKGIQGDLTKKITEEKNDQQ